MSAELGDVAALEEVLSNLVGRLEPGERSRLAKRVAEELRKRNARRIGENVDPEGNPMVPRKKARSKRRRDRVTGLRRRSKPDKMFLRARANRYLRAEGDSGEARIGYVGAMARIMSVHQDGLVDNVTRDPSSPSVRYPVRRVLGLPPEDRLEVLELIDRHLSA